ncbi:MAG TPA: hypothetical protein VLJ37_10425 [bacterium]|nr:hypothetical protein [bacterium]
MAQTQLDYSPPLPYFSTMDESKELAERIDQGDKFRKGRIIKYFPQAGYGFVRDDMGHEVYFHLDEVRFVGKRNDRRYVSEGAPVGFDVGRTSRGLRVTRLKLY